MKLSELVNYLNLLNQDAISPDYAMAIKKFRDMSHVIAHHAVQFDAISSDFKDSVDQVQKAFEQVDHVVDSLKDQIIDEIKQMEVAQFEQSESLYRYEMCNESNEYILGRQLHIDNDDNILLRAHLKNLTDWRLPGMIIRPGRDSFIEDLVPMDPLYLVDQNLELLQPAASAFTPEYQRRLRKYAVDDYQDENPLWQLPNNQFGLIFSWNYFNFKPLSVVYRYLDDIYKKLRPGGVCIFTFNDCDRTQGAQLAEQNFMCYAPGRMIKSYVENRGFEILFEHHGLGNVAWLKIKRPGEIESIRGGQALAKIVAHE